jgi:hypothetical protein
MEVSYGAERVVREGYSGVYMWLEEGGWRDFYCIRGEMLRHSRAAVQNTM